MSILKGCSLNDLYFGIRREIVTHFHIFHQISHLFSFKFKASTHIEFNVRSIKPHPCLQFCQILPFKITSTPMESNSSPFALLSNCVHIIVKFWYLGKWSPSVIDLPNNEGGKVPIPHFTLCYKLKVNL